MAVVYGMRRLIGTPFVLLALAGVLPCSARGLSRAEHAASLVVLALVALMALPAYAFFNGHPFRMRYMVAPSVGAAVFAGIALGMLKARWRHAAVAAIAVWLVATVKPIDAQAPMVQEAQWDVPFSVGRRERHGVPDARVPRRARFSRAWARSRTTCRSSRTPASTSATSCTKAPCPTGRRRSRRRRDACGWILVEERAEGGDMLAHARPRVVRFHDGLHARVRGRRGGAV